jgi:hypothetical protein
MIQLFWLMGPFLVLKLIFSEVKAWLLERELGRELDDL